MPNEILENPLWWVIPAVLVCSWIVNHKGFPDLSSKKGKSSSQTSSTSASSSASKSSETPKDDSSDAK